MKTIKKPEDEFQPQFFADENLGWWASKLSPNALRRLDNGWQGTFRRSVLNLLPAEEIGGRFSEDTGRPTKELYAMAGLMLIAEFKNMTGEEAAEAFTFDASVQYALNLPRDQQYISPRSIDNYRKYFREDELAQQVFSHVSAVLIKELDIDIKRQRLDSTHVLSNMARFGRRQLLAVAVRRFLVQANKLRPETCAQLSTALRERYEASENRLFGGKKPTSETRTEILIQIGEDMSALIDAFKNDEEARLLPAYQDMVRLFAENFEAQDDNDDPPKPRPKSRDSNGGSVRTLQNTSDHDAGYSGKKGAGYQAQIAQTLPPRNDQNEIEGPGLITALIPQSAAVRDNEALPEVIAQQEASGLTPSELTADTIYGSDANVGYCAGLEIKLVSPVPGFKPHKENSKHYAPPEERQLKERLAIRREEQETEEWKKCYAKRSGIEGLNRALDQVTGFKRLRVRGLSAVEMALYLKAAGWNILAAAKIQAKRARKRALAAVAAAAGLHRPYNGLLAIPTRYHFFRINILPIRRSASEATCIAPRLLNFAA